MSEYIERDAVLDRYYAEYEKQDICDGSEDRDWLKRCIDEAPAADVAPVVRCAKCVFRSGSGRCAKSGLYMVDSGFCSYGKDGE